MRILCEGCQAQYHIDDSFMSERGIRAQCPKCSHITIIQKTTRAIREDQSSRLPDVVYCVNCGAPLPEVTDDPIPLCPNCAQDSQTADSQETIDPVQAGSLELDTREPVRPFQGDPDPAGPTSNTFTRAQLDEDGGLRSHTGRWRIKKAPDGRIYGPFDHTTITEWISSGKVTAADQISTLGGSWYDAPQHPDFASHFEGRVEAPQPPPQLMRRSRNRAPRARSFPTGWVILGAVILLLAGGGFAAWRLGWVEQAIELVTGPKEPERDATDRRIEALQASYPGLQGDPAVHLASGRKHLLGDTLFSYELARQDLEMAVVLAPEDDTALALLAETYALLAWYDGQDSLLSDALLFALRAVKQAPDNPDSVRAHATVLLAKRSNPQNLTDARRILGEALPSHSDDPVLVMLRGVAERGRDDQEAEKFLARAVAMAPKMTRPRLELAELAISHYDYDKATRSLRPLTRRSIVAAYRMGELHEKLARYKEASTYFMQAADNAQAVVDNSPQWRVDSTLRWARVRYQALGGVTDALRSLERLASNEGAAVTNSDLRARLEIHLATLYRLTGRTEQATAAAKRAMEESSSLNAAARLQMALALHQQGNDSDAIQVLDKALLPSLTRRERSVIQTVHGQIRAASGAVDEARGQFEDALRNDPYNFTPGFADAVLLVKNKRDNEAIARVLDLAKRDPLYHHGKNETTDLYVGTENQTSKSAVLALTEVKDRQSYSSSAWTALGIARFYAGDRPGARAAFERALQEDNNFNPIAHLYLGLDATLAGNCGAAMKRYEAANRPELQNAHLFTVMGVCQWRLGRAQAAQESFTRAINDDPAYAPAYYWAGKLALAQKQRDEAVSQWEKAVEHDPHYVKAWQALYKAGS